jgi:hypothetical protein
MTEFKGEGFITLPRGFESVVSGNPAKIFSAVRKFGEFGNIYS